MATPAMGVQGSVSIGSLGGLIARSWSANISRPMVDVTAFNDWATRRTQGGGFDITGSVTGILDTDGATASPLVWGTATASATVTLNILASSNAISFYAAAESSDLSINHDGLGEGTINFVMWSTAATATAFAFSTYCTATWS